MKVIGLVGGIGAGKSTVIAEMNKLVPINYISADLVGHEILLKGNRGYLPVIEAFGNEILGEDEEINRKRLGEKVFGYPDQLAILNNITHPIITELIKERIIYYKKTEPNKHIVLEAALLVESGLLQLTDVVVAVYANLEVRLKRVVQRDALSKEQVEARIKTQKEWRELEKVANFIIDNSISLENTKRQVQDILDTIE